MGKIIKPGYFLAFVLLFVVIACEEVIDIELKGSSPNMVVEGFIARDSLCTLKLSFTTDFYDISAPLPVTDALVTLRTSYGVEELLTDNGNGLFTGTTIYGIPGTTYQIEINRPSGICVGETTLYDTCSIISITANPVPFYRPGYEPPLILDITFTDNKDIENFYMMRIFRNDTLMTGSISLASDEFNSTGVIQHTEWQYDFKSEDRARVEVYSIDRNLFAYFMMLNDVSSASMSFSTPYNPRSNLIGSALGYFGSWSYVSDTITVK